MHGVRNVRRLMAILLALGSAACGSGAGTAGPVEPGTGQDVVSMPSTTAAVLPPGSDPARPTFDGPRARWSYRSWCSTTRASPR